MILFRPEPPHHYPYVPGVASPLITSPWLGLQVTQIAIQGTILNITFINLEMVQDVVLHFCCHTIVKCIYKYDGTRMHDIQSKPLRAESKLGS